MKVLKLILLSCLSLLSFNMYAPPEGEAREAKNSNSLHENVDPLLGQHAREASIQKSETIKAKGNIPKAKLKPGAIKPINRSSNKSGGISLFPEDTPEANKEAKKVTLNEDKSEFKPARSKNATTNLLAKYKITDTSNINAKDKDGYTALYKASSLGRDEDVESLIKAGADVNQKNANGKTAFDLASHDKNTALMKILKDNGGIDNTAVEKEAAAKNQTPKKSISDHISDVWNSFTKSISDFFSFGSKAKQKEVAVGLDALASSSAEGSKESYMKSVEPIETNLQSRKNERNSHQNVSFASHAKSAADDYKQLESLQSKVKTKVDEAKSNELETSLDKELVDMVIASKGNSESLAETDAVLTTLKIKDNIHNQADKIIAAEKNKPAAPSTSAPDIAPSFDSPNQEEVAPPAIPEVAPPAIPEAAPPAIPSNLLSALNKPSLQNEDSADHDNKEESPSVASPSKISGTRMPRNLLSALNKPVEQGEGNVNNKTAEEPSSPVGVMDLEDKQESQPQPKKSLLFDDKALQGAKLKKTEGPVKQPAKPNVLSEIKKGRTLSPVKNRPDVPKVEKTEGFNAALLERAHQKVTTTNDKSAVEKKDDDKWDVQDDHSNVSQANVVNRAAPIATKVVVPTMSKAAPVSGFKTKSSSLSDALAQRRKGVVGDEGEKDNDDEEDNDNDGDIF